MTVKVPESVKAAFTAHPEATLAMRAQDMGHGYGKAAFASRCRLTGDNINPGEAIRHVVIWTKAGLRFDGVISNRAVGYLFGVGSRSHDWRDEDGMLRSAHLSTIHKCVDGWETALEAAAPGTQLILIQRTNHTHADVVYTLAADGKWHGLRYSRVSTKQLQATCRRSKRNILWQLRGEV